MAILVMEGFEGYSSYTDVRQRWQVSSSITSSGFVTGRDGSGRAFSLNFTSAIVYFTWDSSPSGTNLVAGFGFRNGGAMAASDVLVFYSENGSSEQIVLRKTAAGELAVDRGSTNLGSTSGLGLIGSTWYYVEIDVTFGDGTAGSVDVYVDNISQISLSSIDTRNVTGENCARVALVGNNNGHEFDDFYILDDTGSDQTTRIGPCFIETVLPDANGTTNNFTASPVVSNYLNVDDGNTPDDDSTYNHSSTATDKDLYGHAALAASIDTIYAVMPRSHCRTNAGGARGVKNVARSSATEVDGTEKSIDGGYRFVDHIYENDPNGGGAWTESSVNAAEFGIKITS